MKRDVKSISWPSPRASWLRIAWVEAWESRHQIRSLPRWLQALFGLAMLLVTLHWETNTGVLESHLFSHWAKGMTFYIQPGPAEGVVFPKGGPADVRRGYTRIPEFTRTLESQGFRVSEQARFSPALAMVARFGISPPYREPASAGLAIEGADGSDLYEASDRTNGFGSYQEIPPIVARSLLFIENRELDKSTSKWSNPAIDWGRWGRAVLVYSASRMGLPVRVEGGSTLAVQVEKYRHSDEGRTGSPVDKLRQVLTASLRVYQEGPDTREERRHIIVDYLNSVPLGATRGHGEVFGLNQGLSVWFGMDPARVMRQLSSAKTPAARARAMKHVLALLCAVRAPSRYLREDHSALERRANAYAGLLAREGIFDDQLAERVRAIPLSFVKRPSIASRRDQRIPLTSKATNRIRIDLEQALAVRGLYDLNRLHLNVESTVDAELQRETERLMAQMSDSSFVAAHGLRGEHLLPQGDPKKVIYSVLLYERTPGRNEVRVHADNLRGPFDVNEGMKMSLGSTAKLRTLVHYLEVVEKLHHDLSGLDAAELADAERGARDPLTRWACETLRDRPSMSAESLLVRAVGRTYSASPGELFFTGGGLQAFVNFDDRDNGRRMSVRDAAAHSTNLVFVRLMRDLVRYHEARLPYSVDEVLSGADSVRRQSMLTEIIDEESQSTLSKAYREYHGLTLDESLEHLLGTQCRSRRHLAVLYLAWHPTAPAESLGAWLMAHADGDSTLTPEELLRMYQGTWLGLEDYAYLLNKDPLEIWTVGALAQDPRLQREDLVQKSADARRLASEWLFRTRNRRAQDLRLRARFERDAFARMTPYWRRLGFPFRHLVPSYATAIGSSADRPAALADLMGMIVNDGEDLPPQRINRLVFAPGTPYHTALEADPPVGHRLLSPAVARTARAVLNQVVESDAGTAHRLRDLFRDQDGRPIPMGGKTGTGDNRFNTYGSGGRLVSSRVVSRTAAFTFFIGARYYGVVTASVYGSRAG
ncbi:MAG TPA: transglycosylase domain-containing protein, partial [Methylomirabilota bacterium]|nr:transglycosylase domain-containing protein [Methylomirabilota bacterium]